MDVYLILRVHILCVGQELHSIEWAEITRRNIASIIVGSIKIRVEKFLEGIFVYCTWSIGAWDEIQNHFVLTCFSLTQKNLIYNYTS